MKDRLAARREARKKAEEAKIAEAKKKEEEERKKQEAEERKQRGVSFRQEEIEEEREGMSVPSSAGSSRRGVSTFHCFHNLHFSRGVEAFKYIVVHMCEQKKTKHGKGCLFQPRISEAVNVFRGLKCQFSGKKGVVLSKFTQILQTQTYLGWGLNLRQSPCVGGDLGVYLKTVFMHAHICMTEWLPSRGHFLQGSLTL